VTAVAIAGDGSLLAVAEANGRVVERDPAYPDRLVDLGAPLGDDAISALRFSSDQHTPAMASTDVVLVDVADPPHARVLGPPLSAHTNAVSALAYSPDGRLLASAGLDRLLILWDVSDPAHPRQIGDPLPAHINKITAIAFAPDGATLVTASADHTFILWDLTDPTRPRQLGDPVTHPRPSCRMPPSPRMETRWRSGALTARRGCGISTVSPPSAPTPSVEHAR
jgi:hypothetical protein